jgi:hypothetical protein
MKLLTEVGLFLKLVAISFIIGFVLGVYAAGKTDATPNTGPRPAVECVSSSPTTECEPVIASTL